ncbi:hybrid sensor histidine kinase/response regulator [Thiocapsa marina]|uniref:Response regulator receiver protein n=1 Tax=Thiocapsa marina 5811 TaxID=768671 RepID=F9U9Q7_9GAMM|nr:response regulator [Thiocapsa marina]EGV18855.1 response regulator receiver protein [Thiocapsa marina 5811]
MDDLKRIETCRRVIADPETSWVLFEQGTCVLLARPTADPAAEAKALLRASGPVLAGSVAGDFSVLALDGGRGWVVSSHHPDIVTLVFPQEIDADAPEVAVGLLGRSKRAQDAARLRVRHVEVRRGTAEAGPTDGLAAAGHGSDDTLQDEATWRMLTAMAREQRVRLHGLSGLLDLLEDRDFDESEERRKFLSTGSGAVGDMLGSLDTLLDGTRLRHGRVEPWLEPVSPARLLEDVVAWLEPAAERRGGVLRSRHSPAAEQWFALDRRRLFMVLRELCLSASGFWFGAASGAEVVLAATVEAPPAGPRGPVFEVVATGGADLQDLAEQLARPPTPEGLVADAFNSGRIGLYLCRRLIDCLGATLDLEAIDGGCRFVLRMPADAVPAPTDRPDGRSVSEPHLAGHVLVVEDNPVNQAVLTRILQRYGASCTCVAGGAEAIARCAEGGIDAVLMDDTLPDMDGCTVTEHIRAQRLGDAGHLPIVGLRVPVSSAEGHETCAGQDAVLMKPVEHRALCDALQPWLGIAPDSAVSTPDVG